MSIMQCQICGEFIDTDIEDYDFEDSVCCKCENEDDN